eukprot:584437-Rhodomonas_salina.1
MVYIGGGQQSLYWRWTTERGYIGGGRPCGEPGAARAWRAPCAPAPPSGAWFGSVVHFQSVPIEAVQQYDRSWQYRGSVPVHFQSVPTGAGAESSRF